MKKLLLSFLTLCVSVTNAQNTLEWALVEPQSGTTVLMKNVGFMLASDNEETFSVICNDGNIIRNTNGVTFKQVDPTSIGSIKENNSGPMLHGYADGRLTLTGCADGTKAAIFDAAGHKVAEKTITGNDCTIDITRLSDGIYILRAGKAAVKFIKK
ncbi:T9SS type A sorting domain-containing protein [Xylanibacter muris]|uniref:T9SS type A sorting domain-containing protein n=1 Tax=Xylanibacter muris TaxID=2736290 RepID=A0ABX2ALK3_9BACT|nr:T9SS type A sorting domain-containing protein [Xylanibacter muris]NPD91665.1 T9SS type A sorting domain-containing protein [Xylanibacter muris]